MNLTLPSSLPKTSFFLISILFFSLLLCDVGAAEVDILSSSSGQDVETLLHRMEKALNGNHRQDQDEARPTPKRKPKLDKVNTSQSALKEQEAPTSSVLGPVNAPPPEVRPIVSADVEKILEVDLKALKFEQERPFPRTESYFLYEQSRLQPQFVLTKDDDTFRPLSAVNTKGLSLGMENRWKVYEKGLVKIEPTVHMDLSLKRGEGLGERRGVEDHRTNYTYNLFQAGLLSGLSVEVWNIRPYVLAGLNQTVLNQQGHGQSDTTNGFFTSEVVEVGMVYSLTSTFELRANYRESGLGFIFKDGLKSRGVLAGVGLAL